MGEREGDGAAVAVEPRRVTVPRPPVLAVPDDAARAMPVQREVVAGEDQPRGLGLDEYHAIGRAGVHPVREVEDELYRQTSNVSKVGSQLVRCR